MVFRIRTVAELFDLTIRLYRRHFTQFFIVAAVGLLPGMVLNLAALGLQSYATVTFLPGASETESVNANSLTMFNLLDTTSALVQNLASVLESALSFGLVVPLVNVVFLAELHGESLTLKQAFQRLGSQFWNLVVLLALLFGLYIALTIWLIIPCVGWGTGLPILAVFGWIGPMTITALLVEGRQGFAAVKRCWLLVRQRVWTALGAIFLIGLFGEVVMVGPLAIVAMFVLLPLQGLGYQDLSSLLPTLTTGTVGGVLAVGLTSVVLYPVTILFTILWYFDLRTRFEGLDLTVRAHQRGGGTLATALRDAPAELNEPFVRGEDIGRFFLMTLALLGVAAIIWGIAFGGTFALLSMRGR